MSLYADDLLFFINPFKVSSWQTLRNTCDCEKASVCVCVLLYLLRWLCSDPWGRSLSLRLCHSPKSSQHCEERGSGVTGGVGNCVSLTLIVQGFNLYWNSKGKKSEINVNEIVLIHGWCEEVKRSSGKRNMEVKCYNLKKEGLTLCFETVQDFEKLNFDFQCPLKITRLWSIKGGFDWLAGFFFFTRSRRDQWL